MPRPRSIRPTDAELAILQIVWQLKTATIRDVHDELVKTQDIAQTAVQSQMAYMHEKGLLSIADERRPQKYRAAIEPEAVSSAFLDVADRVEGGSFKRLLIGLLSRKKATADQIKRAEKLLDELE